LDHFFFLPLPPAMAAAIFCSFDFCCTFGGYKGSRQKVEGGKKRR
jgi:hypothetical protein